MRHSIESSAPLAFAAIAAAVALTAGATAVWLSHAAARRDATAAVANVSSVTLAALRGVDPAAAPPLLDAAAQSPYIASAKLYRGSGELLASAGRGGGAGAEIVCNSVSLAGSTPATLCVESTLAPLAARLRAAATAIGILTVAALALGWVAGRLIVRSITAPLARTADLVDRATREHNWTLRADAAGGDLGRLARSINALFALTHQRELDFRRHAAAIEAANKDLESFAYTVSHDLRAPLGSIDGFTQALATDYGHLLDANGKEYVDWIREGCRQMRDLIEGLLQMSRLARVELQQETVDLSSIARTVAESLTQAHPERNVAFRIREGVRTTGDERLLRAVLENLMSNAFKFTRKREQAEIEFGVASDNGHRAYFVRDNGAGFDPSHAAKMFRPFQRLHSAREFEGTGIGLATVQKIIERHGGRTWAEGEIGKGATIYFTTAEDAARA